MSKERVTISLPAETAAALKRLADAGLIDSVSGWVAEAVEDRLAQQERAQRVIDRWAAEAEQRNPEEWRRALEQARRASAAPGGQDAA